MKWDSDSRFVYWVGTVICSLLPISVAIDYWTFAPIHSGILFNFVLAFVLAFFATNQVLKAKEDFHILKWPFALWVSALIVVFALPFSIKHPEDFDFGWILASPLFMVAAYSFVQSRKPGGGNQLDVPVDIIHGFKRIGWRWVTPPKYDFWLCWIGLLFPAAMSISLFVWKWNSPQNTWLIVLKAAGACFLFWFIVRWITAPKFRQKYKDLALASDCLRVAGILYYCTQDLNQDNIWTSRGLLGSLGSAVVMFMWTGFFERAFCRCSERALPQGINEYEAIEAPSLGL